MKKVLCLLIAALFVLLSLSSCSKPPDISEIRDRLEELISQSYAVNNIIFGEGFAVYARVYDPKESLKHYTDKETGREYYYYLIEDETEGKILAYLETGKFAGFGFLTSSDEKRENETEIYKNPVSGTYYYAAEYTPTEKDFDLDMKIFKDEVFEKNYQYYEIENGDETIIAYREQRPTVYNFLKVSAEKGTAEEIYFDKETSEYYYPLEYTPKEADFYYSQKDLEDYDYVKIGEEYASVEEIKTLAEKVYTKEFLESLYDILFVGVLVDDSNIPVMKPKYMDYTDENGLDWFLQRNDYMPVVTERRIFKIDTAKVVRPGRKNFANIEIESYPESDPTHITKTKLTLVLQNGVWLLDNATY